MRDISYEDKYISERCEVLKLRSVKRKVRQAARYKDFDKYRLGST